VKRPQDANVTPSPLNKRVKLSNNVNEDEEARDTTQIRSPSPQAAQKTPDTEPDKLDVDDVFNELSE
jgi:hypothetical protein